MTLSNAFSSQTVFLFILEAQWKLARLLISGLPICFLTLILFQIVGPVLARDFKDHGLQVGDEESESSVTFILLMITTMSTLCTE